ncbi:MAG: hypothetical protein BroJett040_18580 [Oligoflexia bacterium]|nr:MAG: hypothetical protein BroJett040_18580 [Oligoflexia bacterium]
MTEQGKHPTEKVEFAAGALIFAEGDPSHELYIVQDGQVEVYKSGHGGSKTVLGRVARNEFLGEISFLLDKRHSASAAALTPVVAVKITKASLNAQLADTPSWLISLAKGLAIKLDHSNEALKKASRIGP